jgi:16S rRNA (cytosine1402-N4)-methyltransferase
MPALHLPVLLEETMDLLAVSASGLWVDGTVGLGGHAREILRRSAPAGRLLGVDRDAEALAAAREALAGEAPRLRLVQANYREIPALLEGEAPRGVLLDLGVSSLQLDDAERGFSFKNDGPLDMRMDQGQRTTAAELVNRLSERALADLIYEYGEERGSRRVARGIVWARERAPLTTTGALAAVVRRSLATGRGPRARPGLDPATRTFQALRIAVNGELEGLGDCLRALAATLAPGGRLVVIAFHSLEDREVKQAFRDLAAGGEYRLLTRKPLRPGEDEERDNPRARSARLRGLEKVAA